MKLERRWKRRGYLRYVLLFFLAVATGAFYVFERIRVFELVNQIQNLSEKRESVRGENERLRIELGRLLSREEIERFAIQVLGMRYPKPGEVLEGKK